MNKQKFENLFKDYLKQETAELLLDQYFGIR